MQEPDDNNKAEEIHRLVCDDFVAYNDERSQTHCQLIIFEGKINNTNSYEINRKIHQLFHSTSSHCVLDLENLEYMNSTGVAILFSLYFRIKENEKLFYIGNLHPFLKRIFSLMDFPPELEIVGNTEDAMRKALESE